MERISKGTRYNLPKILPGRQNKLAFKKCFIHLWETVHHREILWQVITQHSAPLPHAVVIGPELTQRKITPTVSPISLPVAPGFFLECFHPNVGSYLSLICLKGLIRSSLGCSGSGPEYTKVCFFFCFFFSLIVTSKGWFSHWTGH